MDKTEHWEKKIIQQTVINALIEKFDDIESLSGKSFTKTKVIILKWAKDNKIFDIL